MSFFILLRLILCALQIQLNSLEKRVPLLAEASLSALFQIQKHFDKDHGSIHITKHTYYIHI